MTALMRKKKTSKELPVDQDEETPKKGRKSKKDNLPYKAFMLHGAKYKTLYTKKFEDRKPWQKPDNRMLLSFIPGTIRKLDVKEGAKVKVGGNLLVLEAMKMNNQIKAEFDCKVLKIHVAEGEKIQKNTLMMELEYV